MRGRGSGGLTVAAVNLMEKSRDVGIGDSTGNDTDLTEWKDGRPRGLAEVPLDGCVHVCVHGGVHVRVCVRACGCA